MKSWLVGIVAALGLTLGGWALLHGQGGAGADAKKDKDKRTITTAGTAVIKVKPDSARIFFGVQTVAPTVRAAREGSAAHVKKVMDALVALKIPNLKSKTANVHVELIQSRARDELKLPETLGYRVTQSFTVLVKEDDREKLGALAGKVLDTALENGANLVDRIVFFKEDETEVKRQAMTKAVEEAIANARAIAAGGKATIVDTVAMDGQPEYYWGGSALSNTAQIGGLGGRGAESQLIAGDIEVTCRVSVTCTY